MPRSGRRPGEPQTRERIADAARLLFAEKGFNGASMRAVARQAGVDPALVLHYFGSKHQLFVETVRLPFDPGSAADLVAEGDASELGARMVRFALDAWERPETKPAFLALLRSAAADPRAAALLRDAVTRRGLAQLAHRLHRPDAELRVALAGSHLIGLAMGRYIIGIEPLAAADPETLVATVGPTIQRYLTGDVAGPDSDPARSPSEAPRAPRRS